MEEALEDAKDELKRVDHLIFVSLKYTRTVDVIKSVIERMITFFDFAIDALLKYAKGKKMITEIPSNIGLRSSLVKKSFSDNAEILEGIEFYQTLRKLSKAKYTKREEYRRHVTMIAAIENEGVVEVDIDLLCVYYEKTKKFISLMETMIFGKND